MNRIGVYAIVMGSLLVGGGEAAMAAKKDAPSKARRDAVPSPRQQLEAQLDARFGPKDAPPKQYENATHQIRFTAPGSWKPASGGCQGSIYNMLIRPEVPEVKPGVPVRIAGSIFTVAANPVKTPGLDGAVKDVQDELKKNYPAVEFKPVEKTTVAGAEARVVTAFMPGKEKDEPKKAERHAVFVRDGKVYDLILYTRVNQIAKETTAVQAVAKSFEWTAAPAATAAKSASAAPAGQADPDGLD